MFRNIGLLLLVVIMSQFNLNAQKISVATRHKQMQQSMGKSDKEYKRYRDSLHYFDQRMSDILKNNKEAITSKEFADAMTQRRLFVQRHMPAGQSSKLHQSNVPSISKRQQKQNESEERMKKKGIKVMKATN